MRAEWKRLWQPSPVLMATAVLMFATFLASVAGIFLDPRIITGMPAWLKPAKFGISTTIYLITIAWLYRYLDVWRGYLRVAAWIVSIVFIYEIAVIDVQAARGVISHFNNASALDRGLWFSMGAAISVMWMASVGILFALCKQKFENPAWGWALRLGMLITVIGSGAGGIMGPPTHDQMQALKAHETVPALGAHTVGAPDGGPGIPGVGWSTEHGDLRIPHFLGMHAIQIIPMFAWLFARRKPAAVWIASASYLALFGILLWQALGGESILAPGDATVKILMAWLAATLVAMTVALWPRPLPQMHADSR
jgi:hypothetical protein